MDQCLLRLLESSLTLQILTWIDGERFHLKLIQFDVEFYDQLVNVVKNRNDNRKLIVTFFPYFVTIPH